MNENPRILIVDDAPANIKLLSELLKKTYRVSVAISGADALKVMETENPDLILLDIMMPVMDGYEVCRRIKGKESWEAIPIIFVTAKSSPEDEQRGLELGAVDYITKPISPPITLARIKNHLELKQTRDNLQQLVEERTKELVASNKLLSWHNKELEGRDRLLRDQLGGIGEEEAYRHIQQIVHDVIGAEMSTIYRASDDFNGLKPVVSCGRKMDSRVEDMGMRAIMERAPKLDADLRAAAAPIIYQEEILGLLCVQGLPPEIDMELQVNCLSRMAQEAAMVLRMGQVTDDLLDDTVDLSELLKIGE